MSVAGRVRELRAKAGMTQAALAKPHYTVSYISKIESGERTPSPGAMEHLALRLGVSARFLATGIPEELEESLRFRLEEAREDIREQRHAEAGSKAKSVLDECDRIGVPRLRWEALLLLGEVAESRGRLPEAIDLLEQALEAAEIQRERAVVVSRLARVYRDLGDLTYARELLESELRADQGSPLDPRSSAEIQTALISIYYERGDMTRAHQAARRALAAAEQGCEPELRAKALWCAARVHAEQRRWRDALDLVARARALMEELDERRSVGKLHVACAFVCIEADPPLLGEAAVHLDEAERRLDTGSVEDLAFVWSERSRFAFRSGDFEETIRQADRALAAFGDMTSERAKCLYLKGRALAAMGRLEEARASLEEAARSFSEQGARQQVAACYREIGALDIRSGDTAAALEHIQAGLAALDAVAPGLEPARRP